MTNYRWYMSESLLMVVSCVVGVVVLGIAWLFYLGNGGKPVRITVKGLGIELDIARPIDHNNGEHKGTNENEAV